MADTWRTSSGDAARAYRGQPFFPKREPHSKLFGEKTLLRSLAPSRGTHCETNRNPLQGFLTSARSRTRVDLDLLKKGTTTTMSQTDVFCLCLQQQVFMIRNSRLFAKSQKSKTIQEGQKSAFHPHYGQNFISKGVITRIPPQGYVELSIYVGVK